MSNTRGTFATLRRSAVPFHLFAFYSVLKNVPSAGWSVTSPSLKQNISETVLFVTVSRLSAVFCKRHYDGSLPSIILGGVYIYILTLISGNFK